ncbi:hypothetical protein AKJ16_DCAP15695 [Drosera capensis]
METYSSRVVDVNKFYRLACAASIDQIHDDLVVALLIDLPEIHGICGLWATISIPRLNVSSNGGHTLLDFLPTGSHGNGRYSNRMLPEVPVSDFRKGAQSGMHGRHCCCDEHYLPTVFHMIDPAGMSGWCVTHVDWSEHKWHPKSYTAEDMTF